MASQNDITVRFEGPWEAVTKLLKDVDKVMAEASLEAARKSGLMAESIAKKKLGGQTENWAPLQERTKKRKEKKGQSDAILIATSQYFQTITTWDDGKKRVLVGVKRTARTREGEPLAEVAAVHEYGSRIRNIPARPLWGPTVKELAIQLRRRSLLAEAFKKRAARYGVL